MSSAWTVFVVDDDGVFRTLVRGILKNAGYDVEEFPSAREFLPVYRAHPRPGCLILDSMMPGMTGPQLQERLLELKIRVPIVMVTSQAEFPLAVQAMRRGAIDYLIKPPLPTALLAAVREAQLQDREARHEDAQRRRTREQQATLSRQQRQLLQLLLDGVDNDDLPAAMKVAPSTVRSHRTQLLQKMEAESLHDLIRKVLIAQQSAG